MKKVARVFFVAIMIASAGFTSSTAQTKSMEEEIDGGGSVVCECNTSHKCVASGGGAVCKDKGDKCWDHDGNCR